MINLRYHIVSIVAVFLALGIGVVMGTTVIDRAVVNILESQQQDLTDEIETLQGANGELSSRVEDLEESSDKLAEEGSQRLLAGELEDVPVLVLAVRGIDGEVLDQSVELIGRAGADYLGTLWLTDRMALESEEDANDLASVLGESASQPVGFLRLQAVNGLATDLRAASGEVDEGLLPAEESLAVLGGGDVMTGLLEAGFLDYQPPEGEPDDLELVVAPAVRIMLVSGRAAAVPDETLAVPLAAALVEPQGALPPVRLLAAQTVLETPENGDESAIPFVSSLRDDEDVRERLSTVDSLADFAGRLAAVLAIEDLANGRHGHYGVGPGAERLLPAATT